MSSPTTSRLIVLALALSGCGKLNADGVDGPGGADGAGGEGPDPVKFADIECGAEHACALDQHGEVHCWGRALRDDPPKGPFTKLAVGDAYSCALRETGSIDCWGDLGYPPQQLAAAWAHPPPPSGKFTDLVASRGQGATMCALSDGAPPACWTEMANGEVVLPNDKATGAVSIVAEVICQLDSVGAAYCGPLNEGFAGGSGWTDLTPGPASERYVAIGTSFNDACGVTVDGKLSCWGNEDWREFLAPLFDVTNRLSTLQVSLRGACVQEAESKKLSCVGANQNLFVSNGVSRILSSGFDQPPAPPFVDWCVNENYGCVLRDSGKVECWGELPDEFPESYRSDYYYCQLLPTGNVVCSGTPPASYGDDYWLDPPRD